MLCPKCNTESGPSLFCYVCDAYLPAISEGVKASLPSRLGAFILDGFIFLIVLLIVGLISLGGGINVASLYHDYGVITLLVVFFAGVVGYLLVFLWFLARGQTPGKWLLAFVPSTNATAPNLASDRC